MIGLEMYGRAPLPSILRPRVLGALVWRLVNTTQARVARIPTTMPGKKPAKNTPTGKLVVSFVGGGLFESMPDATRVGVEVTVALDVDVTLVVVAGPAFDLSNMQILVPPWVAQV